MAAPIASIHAPPARPLMPNHEIIRAVPIKYFGKFVVLPFIAIWIREEKIDQNKKKHNNLINRFVKIDYA